MDISGTYISMSDHPKIQEQWEPEIGDFYFVKDRLFRPTGIVDVYDGKGHAVLPREANYGWLPRQDQIQKMIPLKSKFHRIVDKLYEFTNWIKLNATYVSSSCSMEQLWLGFYMHEKHGLMWDGKKWGKK